MTTISSKAQKNMYADIFRCAVLLYYYYSIVILLLLLQYYYYYIMWKSVTCLGSYHLNSVQTFDALKNYSSTNILSYFYDIFCIHLFILLWVLTSFSLSVLLWGHRVILPARCSSPPTVSRWGSIRQWLTPGVCWTMAHPNRISVWVSTPLLPICPTPTRYGD